MDVFAYDIRAVILDRRHVSESGLRQLASELIESASPLRWILALALSVPVALLVGVPTSGVGIGLLLGLLVAGAVAAHLRVQSRKHAEEMARAIAEARADADGRVGMVARQYEWAVRDATELRHALRRALTPPIGEAPTDKAEQPSEPSGELAIADLTTAESATRETERRPEARHALGVAVTDKRGRVYRREDRANKGREVEALAS